MRFTSVIYFLQDWSAEAKEDSRFRAPAPRVHRSVGPGHRPGGGWSAAPQQRAVPWVPSLVLQGDSHEATAAVDRSGLRRHRVFGGRGHRVRPFYSGRQSCWGWTYVRSCGMLACIYIFSYNWTRYHNSVRYGYYRFALVVFRGTRWGEQLKTSRAFHDEMWMRPHLTHSWK